MLVKLSSACVRHWPFAEVTEVFQNLVAPFRRVRDLNGQAVGYFLVPA